MAKYKLVSVFDSASGVYARPFPVVAIGQAMRDFTDEINRDDKDNALFKHPEDYALFVLGDFDDSSGFLLANEVPTMIVRGKDVAVK